ncbi:MAG TPA: type 4a pilus biogenesis protein PilO [Firmicutes bacterium]|nr:type 4a pilus biogenesis protein PilO [Bacillota bacterium]
MNQPGGVLLSRRDYAFLGGLVLAAFAAFVGLFVLPAQGALEQQRQVYERLQHEVELGKREARRLDPLSRQVRRLTAEVGRQEARLLGEAALPRLAADVEAAAKASGARLLSLQPGKAEEAGGFRRFPVVLELQASSAQLEAFLHKLASLPYAVRVEGLQLNQAAGGAEPGAPGTLAAHLAVALVGLKAEGAKSNGP